MSNFDVNYDKGCFVEDFISEYVDEMFGWKFVAGARRGEMHNISEIERLFSCRYIAPIAKKKGPSLDFLDGEEPVIMPDILFRSKKDWLFWVESKSSFDSRFYSVDIPEEKIRAYTKIQMNTKSPVWIIVSLVDGDYCEIYSARINDINKLINSGRLISFYNKSYKKECYTLNVKTSLFVSLSDGKIKMN